MRGRLRRASDRSGRGPAFEARCAGARGGVRPLLNASLALLALIVLVPAGCAGESEGRSLSGTLLAFESFAGGTWEIFVANTDGDFQRLTYRTGPDGSPVWSPDGRRIAFTGCDTADLPCEILVMDADGGNQRNITSNPLYDLSPSWSPDGRQIAFERDGAIAVMYADGGGQRTLTQEHSDDHPAWSPDGTRIAFERSAGEFAGHQEIYVMNADGREVTNLTWSGVFDARPAWSPDGRTIAFEGDGGVYVMNADGSSPRRLASGYIGAHPWSPDGRKLVFESGSDDDIYVVNRDGSGLQRLTQGPADDRFPAWSFDGKQIAFARDDVIYVMSADGSSERRLIGTPLGWSRSPAFQPSP